MKESLMMVLAASFILFASATVVELAMTGRPAQEGRVLTGQAKAELEALGDYGDIRITYYSHWDKVWDVHFAREKDPEMTLDTSSKSLEEGVHNMLLRVHSYNLGRR
jgi:hypothetical protein